MRKVLGHAQDLAADGTLVEELANTPASMLTKAETCMEKTSQTLTNTKTEQ